MHSLFGFVTELIIVKHRDSPACFSGWRGFSVSMGLLPGGVWVCVLRARLCVADSLVFRVV